MLPWLILVGLFLLGLLWLIAAYNGFVRLKNQADESWSGIDVQLKRRHDLIPNLVETVKGYAKHERGTLDEIVRARSEAMNATAAPQARANAENALTSALKSLFALAEAYPDLKANQNFLGLQKSLSEIEDQLQQARRYYNAVVRDFNIQCEAFPTVLIANAFGFRKREFFEAPEGERATPAVSF
jgi:LemA protein